MEKLKDKYTLKSMIGKGSFGRVYKGHKKLDANSIVAVKIISKLNRSAKDLKSLQRECNIQAKLDHPNIIKIFETFKGKTELILVTEYLSTDLHCYLSKYGTIPENKVETLSGHLVSALYYLHSNRILHRDLKPQNVLLDENLHSKLCDFGLARNMAMGTHVLTSIKGTPLYMAPEILSEKPYDHKADLWSLGCIIYESLVGQPPFDTNSIVQLIRLINLDDVKWPSFISNNCVSLLQGLLEKNPSLRSSWAQILCNPFLENKLNIPEGCILSDDYISVSNKKEMKNLSKNLSKLSLNQDNLSSSKDSISAILQSDIENIETDVEDQKLMLPFTEPFRIFPPHVAQQNIPENACVLSGNPNLIIANFNDYFQSNEPQEKQPSKQSNTTTKNMCQETSKINKNSPLKYTDSKIIEKEKVKKSNESTTKAQPNHNNSDEKLSNSKNTPPCLPNGWDSCDSDDPPAIENEEWQAFLNRTMEEILAGETDSIQERNFLSVIIAPLRNIKAIPIYEQIAKLISLPLIIQFPSADIILNIYIELKVVPNLMYASKLITISDHLTESISVEINNFKNIKDLNNDEIRTLDMLYEAICHLAHLNEKFLIQFCDAMQILSINELYIMILNSDLDELSRCISNILALFCCVLISNQENIQLVENVIYDSKLNLIRLLRSQCDKVKERICILFRILSKLSLNGLKILWLSNSNIREGFELLACDDIKSVRTAAENLLQDIKLLSFY